MKLLIIDGQGGKIGKILIEAVKKADSNIDIMAVGTNSAATANMMKALPNNAATGENAVIVAARTADIIAGPVGIAIADSLYGEVTSDMARSVGQSVAKKVLIPINRCSINIAGVNDKSVASLISDAVRLILDNSAE